MSNGNKTPHNTQKQIQIQSQIRVYPDKKDSESKSLSRGTV